MEQTRNPQNILVTGGAGFIGSAFIRYLLTKANFNGLMVNVDLLTYAADLSYLEGVDQKPNYRFYQADINDQKKIYTICRQHNIDTIVHFAAETHVDNSIELPEAFIRTNICGTFSLLEVVRKLPQIHFHQISTDEVFGSLGNEGSFSEMSSYRPNSPYSASKASADHLVRSYGTTYNMSYTLSHCTNNYGPRQHLEKFIPKMINNCLEEKPLPIYGDGSNVRDWLFVEDHARALESILLYAPPKSSYGISACQEMSNIALVHKIAEILSTKLSLPLKRITRLIAFIQDRPGHDFRYSIDCSKLKQELAWRPLYSIEEGLNETIEYYLKKLLPVG